MDLAILHFQCKVCKSYFMKYCGARKSNLRNPLYCPYCNSKNSQEFLEHVKSSVAFFREVCSYIKNKLRINKYKCK